MKRRVRHYRKTSRIKEIILKNISNNIGIYIVSGMIFVIGIIIGVFLVNNLGEEASKLEGYVNSSLQKMQEEGIDRFVLFKEVLQRNLMQVFILWLAGITIIGLIADYILIAYKGFCIGYTISSFILIFGRLDGTILSLTSMLLQNLAIIPAIFFATSSGMNILKTLLNNRSKENIVFEYIRHTIIAIFLAIIVGVASILEVFISYELFAQIL